MVTLDLIEEDPSANCGKSALLIRLQKAIRVESNNPDEVTFQCPDEALGDSVGLAAIIKSFIAPPVQNELKQQMIMLLPNGENSSSHRHLIQQI